jgi:hypothetical protein
MHGSIVRYSVGWAPFSGRWGGGRFCAAIERQHCIRL